MHDIVCQQVKAIHHTGIPWVVVVTGGGASALAELLAVPGGSRTLLEGYIPYSPTALAEWLGGSPDHACSEATARAMAMVAWERARQLVANQTTPVAGPVAGLALTAALATDRPKRGPRRIHLAWQTADTTATISLELTQPTRTRQQEEQLACELALCGMAQGCQLTPLLAPALSAGEQLHCRQAYPPMEWRELLFGSRDVVGVNPPNIDVPAPVLFPGAFNPLHEGHRAMAQHAEQRLGRPVWFELSITNVDKPPLDYLTLEERTAQFATSPLLLTRAATFVEKARLYPGCTLVVGADTIARIGDPKYYQHDATRRDAAVAELAQLGCRFLVFGRQRDGQFTTLSSLALPTSLAALCDEVPEEAFRRDISSTAIRRAGDDG